MRGGETMAKESRDRRKMRIKQDLISQLESREMNESYWLDLINDYMNFWEIKEKLKYEIQRKGVMIEIKNGSQKFRKRNDAIVELPKISKRMTDILLVLRIESQTDSDGEVMDDDY